jgi:hypothetical protein
MIAGFFTVVSQPKNWFFSLLLIGLVGWGWANYKVIRPFPGPLSAQQSRHEALGGFQSHAMFEQECRHCHVPVHCLSDDRCQSCHKEVALERQAAQGLHGQLLVSASCRDCHTEHKGREAQITQFIIASEEHTARTNFSLELHKANFGGELIECANCHTTGSVTVDCLTCHVGQDHDAMAAHIEAFGADCLVCHDGRQREAPFIHERLFILDGAHETAECAACHDSYQIADQSRVCHDCHEQPDIHAVGFGVQCQQCHTTSDNWHNARLILHFFPLDHGDEGQLACASCHQQNYTTYSCDGCHEPAEMAAAHIEERDDPDYWQCANCHGDGRIQGGANSD